MVADLYVGTSSSVLSFVSSATFSTVPGKWNTLPVQIPGIPGGTTVFVATVIRDQAFAPAPLWAGFIDFPREWAYSQEFTFTLGAGITYPAMWGTNGNWAVGTYPLDQYGVGSKGAINVSTIPEPASAMSAGFFVFLAAAGRARIRRTVFTWN